MATTGTDLNVLAEMRSIFVTEYARYKEAFRYAVNAIEIIPTEACDHMRNAFDHFSMATLTEWLASAPSSADVAPPAVLAELLEGAGETSSIDLNRSRKHIGIAAYFCFAHVIAHRMEQIAEIMASLPPSKAEEMRPLQGDLTTLGKRLEALPPPPVERKETLQLVLQDIATIEKLNVDIGGIARDYDALLRKAYAASGAC